MARPLRIEYPGAFYHVSARGFGGQSVFQNDADYASFLALLAESCAKTGWRVHGYCLLPEHYHLLLETPTANLVSGMTWFQNSFTMEFNARRGRRSGAVFGDRYRSVPVEVDHSVDGGPFYRAMLDFIHLAPVREGLLQPRDDLRTFRWSSVSFFGVAIGMRRSWQAAKMGLASFGFADSAVGRNQFIDRLNDRKRLEPIPSSGVSAVEGQSPHCTLKRGWYFGSLAFRAELDRRLAASPPNPSAAPASAGGGGGGETDELARHIVHFGLPKLALDEASLPTLPKNDWRKALIAHLLTRHTSVTLSWIAKRLYMGSRSGVCRHANAMGRELAHQAERRHEADLILGWARAELSS